MHLYSLQKYYLLPKMIYYSSLSYQFRTFDVLPVSKAYPTIDNSLMIELLQLIRDSVAAI